MPKKVKMGGKIKLDPETILIIVLLVILVALVIVYVVTNNKLSSVTTNASPTTARFTDYKEGFNPADNIAFLHNNTFAINFVYTQDCPYSKNIYTNLGPTGSILQRMVNKLFGAGHDVTGPASTSFKSELKNNNQLSVTFNKVLYIPRPLDMSSTSQATDTATQSSKDIELSSELEHHVQGVPMLIIRVDHAETGEYVHYVYDGPIVMNQGDYSGGSDEAPPIKWIHDTINRNLSKLQKHKKETNQTTQ